MNTTDFATSFRRLSLLLAVACLGAFGVAALHDTAFASTPDDEAWHREFSAASGRELIHKLQDNATRDRALFELKRRATKRTHASFDDFLAGHHDVEVVVCPQGPRRDPIYLVLYDFHARRTRTLFGEYPPVPDPDTLFPTSRLPGQKRAQNPAIDAYAADGKRLKPFGGDNVLHGTLADINGDGRIERIEIEHHHIEGVDSAEVLRVWTVAPTATPLFAVLLNWGASEWTFRLRPDPASTSSASLIELGPRHAQDLLPRATYRWRARSRSYVGPAGRPGDHFRRLDSDNISRQLETLRASGLTFPLDPDSTDHALAPSTGPDAQPPPSAPYQARDLAALPDAELLRLMGPGRTAHDFEQTILVRDQLPPDFWTLDPKHAALSFADANRTENHRTRFQLAVDDRDAPAPPAVCTIALTDSSSRCYNAIDAHYFLRVDPEGSYLAYARSWSGGAVFYNFVHDQPAFDLRLVPLPYADARHLAATVWWLDRLRSRAPGAEDLLSGMSFSTADGFGTLTLRDAAGDTLLEHHKTQWSAPLSERWTRHYTPEVFLNLAAHLITRALPERLGPAWSSAAPAYSQDNYTRQTRSPRYPEAERRRVTELATRYLDWFSPTEDRVSFAIAACAADVVGTLVVPDADAALATILAAPPASTPATPAPADPVASPFPTRADRLEHLRLAVTTARRQLATAQDPDALHAWITERASGSQWALQRLAVLDPARYLRALEWGLAHVESRWSRQLFDEIVRVDAAHALSLAATLPPAQQQELAPAIAALRHTTPAPLPSTELAALLTTVQDPRAGWSERREALDLLVPPDDPLRHPQAEVDAALLRVLEPDMADPTVNFTLAGACRALARRQRVESFDRIESVLRAQRDAWLHGDVLAALVHLGQSDPARFQPRLHALLAPELHATNKFVNELLWAVWAADLRELQPDLERLATSGPEDYEDAKAQSAGGDAAPLVGRFHLARQIADLWRAPNAATRIRLLTALAVATPHEFNSHSHPERAARLRRTLAKSAATLTAPERERVDRFIQTAAIPPPDAPAPTISARQKILVTLQTLLATP